MTQLVFEHIPIQENNEPLVDLAGFPFVIEPVYFNQGHSKTPKMHLRKGVADKLLEVQKGFEGKYRFKIWDGSRPRAVQDSIFLACKLELAENNPERDKEKLDIESKKYINQHKVPPHTTGGAVDLTLVDSSGNELDMGTKFDHFGPEASIHFFDKGNKNKIIRDNRTLLRKSMLKAGFSDYEVEWWHFNWGNQMWAADLDESFAFYGEAEL